MSLEKRRVPDFVQLVWTAHGLERNVWKNFPMCVLTFTSTCYKNNLMVNNKIISFHPWLFYVSPSFLCHMTLFSWNPTIKLSVLLTCNWDGTMFVWYGKEVFFFFIEFVFFANEHERKNILFSNYIVNFCRSIRREICNCLVFVCEWIIILLLHRN